jgi:hypothetical protein
MLVPWQLLLLPMTCCGRLLQAVASLGPGSWFGGGSTIYGPGQLLLALRVVAKGALRHAARHLGEPASHLLHAMGVGSPCALMEYRQLGHCVCNSSACCSLNDIVEVAMLLCVAACCAGSSCELIHLPLDVVAQQGADSLIR